MHFFSSVINFSGSRITPIFTCDSSNGTRWYALFEVYFESHHSNNRNDAISKSAPNDFNISHLVRMDETNTLIQTKSEPHWTSFERFKELRTYGICNISHLFFHEILNFQFRVSKL